MTEKYIRMVVEFVGDEQSVIQDFISVCQFADMKETTISAKESEKIRSILKDEHRVNWT